MRTFQAEDEIAGIGAALGAVVRRCARRHHDQRSRARPQVRDARPRHQPRAAARSSSTSSAAAPRPACRPRPSRPTCCTRSYGRHGEAPLPILAPKTPSDCFAIAIEAIRIAVKYRTPVIVLSDGYLANGAEPWRLPDLDALEPIDPAFASEPNHVDDDGNPSFWPYIRDPETLARPWAPPGLPGLEHRIGGLEKEDGSGNVSYEGVNHERMVHLRRDKIAGIAADIPPVEVNDESGDAQLLLVSWGSTYAAVLAGVKRVRARGMKAAHVHLRHLHPLPAEPGRGAEPLRPDPGARDQPGPAEPGAAGRVPGRRADHVQDARRAVPRRRDRSSHHRAARREVMSESNGSANGSNGSANGSANGAVATAVPVTSRKDWSSDQEVRWCPGCGDYSILAAVQMLMPDLGVRRENTVFLSGIGCAARFPYYMNTYGMHSIHGRAPAIATGLATTRPDLDVWVISGDGDALSIGGNHLIHALRRNVRLNIIMFNNQIYGLTKGQYSPTSEVAKVTKSTPFGSVDTPFNPVSLALGAEATFVARTHDMDRAHMQETFRRAHEHQGAAFVEVLQNCNVFNDGAFEKITAKDARTSMLIPLRHGQPIVFGPEGEERGVVQRPDGKLEVVVGRRRRRSTRCWCTTRRARTRASRSGCRGWPWALRADADRRVPRRGAARVRHPDGRADHRRRRTSAASATWGRCCGRARAGRSTERRLDCHVRRRRPAAAVAAVSRSNRFPGQRTARSGSLGRASTPPGPHSSPT